MVDYVLKFPQRKKQNPLPSAEDLAATTLALTTLVEEEQTRPELVATLKTIPRLLAEYLTLPRSPRSLFADFRSLYPDYLIGQRRGSSINYFYDTTYDDIFAEVSRYPLSLPVVSLARRCRFAHQLITIFDFYEETQPDRPFNRAYIAFDPQLQEKHGRLGYNLLQNMRYSSISLDDPLTLDDLVELATPARPLLPEAYQPRRLRNLVFLRS